MEGWWLLLWNALLDYATYMAVDFCIRSRLAKARSDIERCNIWWKLCAFLTAVSLVIDYTHHEPYLLRILIALTVLHTIHLKYSSSALPRRTRLYIGLCWTKLKQLCRRERRFVKQKHVQPFHIRTMSSISDSEDDVSANLSNERSIKEDFRRRVEKYNYQHESVVSSTDVEYSRLYKSVGDSGSTLTRRPLRTSYTPSSPNSSGYGSSVAAQFIDKWMKKSVDITNISSPSEGDVPLFTSTPMYRPIGVQLTRPIINSDYARYGSTPKL